MANEALQIDALWSGLFSPINGKAYSGSIVATYATDGSTPKAIWENKEKTQPSTLGKFQVTLDSVGAAEVFGDGVYVIKVYAPTDTLLSSPLRTLDGLSYIISVDPSNEGYDSIADMRAGTGGAFDGFVKNVLGYYDPSENQDWQFQWDDSSVLTDNGFSIIKVTSITTGRWVRLLENPYEVNVKMFGAIEDGATTDSVFLQNAVDYFGDQGLSGVVNLNSVSYAFDATVYGKKGVKVVGPHSGYGGNGAIFISNVPAGEPCYQMGDDTESGQDSGLYNVEIVAGTNIDGIGLRILWGWNNTFEKVRVSNFTTGTGIKVQASLLSSNASIQNNFKTIYLSNNLTNLHLRGETLTSDEGYYENLRINLANLANATGVHFDRANGNLFDRLSVFQPTAATAGSVGLKFTGDVTNLYSSTAGNEIFGLWMEFMEIPATFSATCTANIIHNFHSAGNTYEIQDLSGGGNIYRYPSFGWNRANPAMTYIAQTQNNLLENSFQERWENGTTSPSGWDVTGAGGTSTRNTADNRSGTYCAELVRSGADVAYSYTMPTGSWEHLKGRWVTFGAWVKTVAADQCQLRITDSVGSNSGYFHSGGGTYEFLTVRRKIESAATSLIFTMRIRDTDGTAYFDSAMAQEGIEVTLPQQTSINDQDVLENSKTWNPASLANGEATSTTVTMVDAQINEPCIATLDTIGADLVTISAVVSSLNTVTVMIVNHTGGVKDVLEGNLVVKVFK